MQDQPAPEQPARPVEAPKETEAERRARVKRDNAFMDLVKLMQQNMAPAFVLAGVEAQLYNGDQTVRGKLIVHADPGQVTQALEALIIQVKQIEIGFNTLLNLYLQQNPELREKFYEICGASAEKTEQVMRRQILSQGTQAHGIVKPS